MAVARATGVALDEDEMLAAVWRTADATGDAVLVDGAGHPARQADRDRHAERLRRAVAASALGVPTPVNRALHALVRLREAGDDLV